MRYFPFQTYKTSAHCPCLGTSKWSFWTGLWFLLYFAHFTLSDSALALGSTKDSYLRAATQHTQVCLSLHVTSDYPQLQINTNFMKTFYWQKKSYFLQNCDTGKGASLSLRYWHSKCSQGVSGKNQNTYPRAKSEGYVLGCASAISVLWGILLLFFCCFFALGTPVMLCLTVLQGYVHIQAQACSKFLRHQELLDALRLFFN